MCSRGHLRAKAAEDPRRPLKGSFAYVVSPLRTEVLSPLCAPVSPSLFFSHCEADLRLSLPAPHFSAELTVVLGRGGFYRLVLSACLSAC